MHAAFTALRANSGRRGPNVLSTNMRHMRRDSPMLLLKIWMVELERPRTLPISSKTFVLSLLTPTHLAPSRKTGKTWNFSG